MDVEQKLNKHIGWLNHNGGLAVPITAREVIYPLCSIGHSEAMKILKDLETNASTVKNPTSWIIAAAGRHGGAAGYAGYAGYAGVAAAPGQMDATGKIGKTVGYMNKQITEKEKKISYQDVVGPLSLLDVTSAMRILKDLSDNIATVRDPTAYVVAAAGRRAGQKRPWDMVQMSATPASVKPVGEEAKKLSRHIGYMNKHGGFTEPISYAEVKAALEAVGHRVGFKILKDLEDNKSNVQSPTGYIIAACKRAASAEVAGKPKVERKPNEISNVTLCWDFVQGHCSRGDQCKFEHTFSGQSSGCGVAAVQAVASSLGVVLGHEAVAELATIPQENAKALIEEIAAGGRSKKGIQDQVGYVSKVCRRIRADAYTSSAGLKPSKRARTS